jgi:hypothetical protein
VKGDFTLKWKVRRMVEKCMLFLVGIKPIRWFFDQLFRFGEWASKQPILSTIWRWYGKLSRPFWIGFGSYLVLLDAWQHDWISMIVNIACVILWIILPSIDNRDDGNDEDEPDEPDPTPNGDAVDMWIKEQQKVTV